MTAPPRTIVVELYEEGVEAFATVTSSLTDREWHRTACGDWSCAELARHVLAVSQWYGDWLDRAECGSGDKPFDADELPDRNELSIHELRHQSGPDAVASFLATATAYVERVTADESTWDRPYGYPYGIATAGLHLGAAAAEWHLHTWDVATAVDLDHRPDRPDQLLRAVGSCVAATTPGVRGRILDRVVDLRAGRNPWPALLKRSGRR